MTRQGDTLDYICWRYYGTERGGTVEAVLEANRGLADYGTHLPVGIIIDMPDLSKPAEVVELIHLWD